jgi:Fe-S-cluster-containing dehydrogenase component
MARYGMVIDLTKCVGCRACMVACKIENSTPRDVWFMYVFRFEEGEYPNVRVRYLPRPCMHCQNPPCVRADKDGARIKWRDWLVETDYDNHKGDRSLELACPYGVNFFIEEDPDLYIDWSKDEFTAGIFGWFNPDLQKPSKWDGDPEKKERRLAGGPYRAQTVGKCTFCIHRLDKGIQVTACQQVCPVRAIIFGDLDDPNSEISKVLEGKVERKKVKVIGPGKVESEEEVVVPKEGSGVFVLKPEAGTYPKVFYIGDPPDEDARPIEIIPVKKGTQAKGDEKWGNLDIPFGLPEKEKKKKK